MIVWQRWGILVFLVIGLSVGTGFILATLFAPDMDSSPVTGTFVGIGLMFGGLYTWLLWRFLLVPHLDKPRVATVAQKFVDPATGNTMVQQVPVVNQATGEEVVYRPRSTLFFIPVGAWVVILPVGGAVVALANVFQI